MIVININSQIQEVRADTGKIIAFVSAGELKCVNVLYKNPNTTLGAKEFNTIADAEQYFGVAYEQQPITE